jgi:hypothetical protein
MLPTAQRLILLTPVGRIRAGVHAVSRASMCGAVAISAAPQMAVRASSQEPHNGDERNQDQEQDFEDCDHGDLPLPRATHVTPEGMGPGLAETTAPAAVVRAHAEERWVLDVEEQPALLTRKHTYSGVSSSCVVDVPRTA